MNRKAFSKTIVSFALGILVLIGTSILFTSEASTKTDIATQGILDAQCNVNPNLKGCENRDCSILECSKAEEKKYFVDSEKPSSSTIIKVEPNSKEVERIISGDSGNIIETFAKDNNIESSKLRAFIEVESNGKPFDGDHPTVRFECLRYNKRVSQENKVPCDITDRKPFGVDDDTGKTAFLAALEKDREQALSQSSYGLPQILGVNFKEAGYDSVEDFYASMFKESEQINAFLTFLKNYKLGLILEELKKEDTDWREVARLYNGPKYEENDYHTKLAKAEERFSSS